MFVQSSLNYVNAFNPSLFIVINGISLFFIFTGVYICCSKEKKIAAKDKEVADRKNKSNHPKSFECKSTSSKALKTATVSSATAKKTTVCDVGKQVSQNKTERKTAENTANQPCALETKDETTKASNPKFGKYVPSKSDASMSSNFDATKTERSDRPVKTTPSTKIFNFFSSLKSFGLSRKKSKITVTQPPPIDNSSSTSTDDKSRMIDKPGRPDDVPPSYTGGATERREKRKIKKRRKKDKKDRESKNKKSSNKEEDQSQREDKEKDSLHYIEYGPHEKTVPSQNIVSKVRQENANSRSSKDLAGKRRVKLVKINHSARGCRNQMCKQHLESRIQSKMGHNTSSIPRSKF